MTQNDFTGLGRSKNRTLSLTAPCILFLAIYMKFWVILI